MRKLLLLWLFMCSILLISLNKLEVSGQSCLGSQQSLMLQLKDSLTFDRALSTKLVKWNNSLDCCSWEGVSCREGRVTSLDLSREGIFGVLDNSSTLFNLQHLERLDLSFNYFFGSRIPSRIGSLTNLSYLDLSNAGLVGQIPEELSRLTRLVTLDISALPFSQQVSYLKLENPNLSMLIQNLSKLEQLYLDGVNMSKHGSQWSRALSSSVPNLRVLSLIDCSLSGPLDPSLEKLQALSIIWLDFNNLSSPVPAFFSSFSNLTSLSLLGCGLQGTFPGEIFQIPTLQIIDISLNEFLQGTLPEFRKNNSLQELFVRDTNFSGSLPTSIGNLQNLSRLDLSDCQFSGILPRFMEQLTQLLYVDLSNNTFTGQVPSFKTSKNLTDMILAHNSFSGTIPPYHWEGLNKLAFLDLQNNLLSGNIHSSLFTLPLLEVVLLSNNQFKGQLPEFPNVSSPLGTLDLSSNNLEGPIPMSIYQLRNLSVLEISFNKLNGTIQLDHVKEFRSLTTLDLSYNNLTVNASGNDYVSLCFPKISRLLLASCKMNAFPDLRNQSNLVHLDLSNNQIGEEVPNWIWKLGNGSLLYLNLSHNNLVGMQEPYSIPTSLSVLDFHSNRLRGKFPNLLSLASFIDFSSNNFNSSIPADIGDYLKYTIYFSISNNSLTGDIPESICNAGYLQVLDLSYNGLSSTIPRCVLGMSQTLGVLNLQGNKFSGQIRDVFPVNCALETLDLNGNLIQGQIPKSLSNCRRLEVLDLGNNMLTGHFPCLLNNISTLRVLVMRSNRFQGNLGCPNSTGFWENLQIIDLARNNFDGKIGGPFLTAWKAMRDDDDDAQQKIKHLQFAYLELSPSRYYRDAVTVTFKGLEMKLQKILTLFTSVDLSCNNFSGPIPEEVGQLRALYILNLSHNALTGEIPPSTGNLRHLESLDLSSNFLSGVIPETLATLNFLSFLNLSFNHLVGRIPSGSQFQTFSNHSYAGNEALCGFPLAAKCGNAEKSTNNIETNSSLGIDWNIISFETGFIFGLGGVVWPLLLCRQFRRRYYQRVDDIAFMTFPRIYQRFL